MSIPATAADIRVARNLLVVQAWYVARPRQTGRFHYEIWCAPDADAQPLILLTQSEALYDAALTYYGTPRRLDAHWRPGRRADHTPCKVLTAITRTQQGPAVLEHGRP